MMKDYTKYLPMPFSYNFLTEIWLPVKDYEYLYEVSSLGRIRSYKTKRILKPSKNKSGYLLVALSKNGKPKTYRVNRIVCEAFKCIPDGCHADHLNFIRDDNRFDNIRPLHHSENEARVSDVGRKRQVEGAKKSLSKKIKQFDKQGNLLKEWSSLRDIERETGFAHNFVLQCCKGKYKQAYGYVWKYA